MKKKIFLSNDLKVTNIDKKYYCPECKHSHGIFEGCKYRRK